ncbi:MAG: hypothetical protein LR011_12610 [Verrucomicrobia bacterium]|nr:hypothetical protein [Verrucomicrobiota bacterium]
MGLSSPNQLASLAVSGQSNIRILSQAIVEDGLFKYEGVTDFFGQVLVYISGQGVDGRPYSGTVKITVGPLTRQFSGVDQAVPENSGQHVFNLLPLMGLSRPDQIASLEVSSLSNSQILSQVVVVNGQLNYQGATDRFGQVVVSLAGRGVDGRPYTGTVTLMVSPLTRVLTLIEVTVEENSGQQSLNLVPFFRLSSGAGDLAEIRITANSNAELLSQFGVIDGQLIFLVNGDQFGTTNLQFQAEGNDGRPYMGEIAIHVTPITRTFTLPEQVLEENSNQVSLNLATSIPLSAGTTLVSSKVSSLSNSWLLEQITVENGILFIKPAKNQFGQIAAGLTALGSDGRPYTGTLNIIVSGTTLFAILADHIFQENQGEQVLSLDSARVDGQPIPIIWESAQSLAGAEKIHALALRNNHLVVMPAANSFGSIEIKLSGKSDSGRRVEGVLRIYIQSEIRKYVSPALVLAAGSPVRLHNILNFPGAPAYSNLQRFEILNIENESLLKTLSINQGTATLEPLHDAQGEVKIHFSGMTTDQLRFEGEFTVWVNTYRAWQLEYFSPSELGDESLRDTLWGEHADPDSDGWENYLEYCFGGNPSAREENPAGFPQMLGCVMAWHISMSISWFEPMIQTCY